MKLPIEIYVDGVKLDMFKDETVKIERSLKKIRDPKSIFTDLSRTISAPASKTNNKIFKHIYDNSVLGTDIRKLIDAEILLNGVKISTGFVNVESVKLKDGVANTYKLRYTGSLAQIKKKLKEDKLSALDFSDLDFEWNSANVAGKLSTPSGNKITMGLNSVRERIIKHTTDKDYTFTTGIYTDESPVVNIHNHGGAWTKGYALNYRSIRPSLQVAEVFRLLRINYGLYFTGAMQEEIIEDLYILLHRKDTGDGDGANVVSETMTINDDSDSPFFISSDFIVTGEYDYASVNIIVSGTGIAGLELIDATGNVVSVGTVSGTNATINDTLNGQILGSLPMYLRVTGEQGETYTVSTTSRIDFYANTGFGSYDLYSLDVRGSHEIEGLFEVNKHIPNIKIVEFLDGLFKMFNIVVTSALPSDLVSTNASQLYEIKTEFQEDFITGGQRLMDITEYVDFDNTEVSQASLFSSVKLTFEEPVTRLGKAFADANGRRFGELEYVASDENSERIVGSGYEVKVPFQNIVGEPLTNIASPADAFDVSYVHLVDKDGKEVATKPFLHYITNVTADIALTEGEYTGAIIVPKTSFNVITPARSDSSTSFNTETDYALYESTQGKELFNKYSNLIVSSLDPSRRMVSVDAHLPAKFHQRYKMNDTLMLRNADYKIDKIDTNYSTGKSRLDLVTYDGMHNVGNISMIGDSRFTNNEIKQAIATQVSGTHVGSTTDNLGQLDDAIGGDTSADLSARWSNVPTNADYYLWHFGTNDSGANNLTNTMNTLSPLMEQLLGYGGKVIYVIQIPRSDANEQFCINLDNQMISDFGDRFHATIDARSIFNALANPFTTHYSDHVHLNSTGNELFGHNLGRALDSYLR